MPPPSVIREASGVIAILKPAGLATQAPPGIPSVESWLRQRLHGGDAGGYVGVPHRLDRAVSGVLLMAATPRAARKLSRQFERRQVAKTYLAVVSRRGGAEPPSAAGDEWRDVIEKLPDEARSRLADPTSPAAREAVTVACSMRSAAAAPPDALLLRLEPRTGRMHQLRIQASSRGLAIDGDDLYGGRPLAGDVVPAPILLHAWRIGYTDPDSGATLTIEAPLPDHWPAWARPA